MNRLRVDDGGLPMTPARTCTAWRKDESPPAL
jgi:hypothetical protein